MPKIGLSMLFGMVIGAVFVWRITDSTRRELNAFKQARVDDDLFAIDLIEEIAPAAADAARNLEWRKRALEERLIGRIVPKRKPKKDDDDDEEQEDQTA